MDCRNCAAIHQIVQQDDVLIIVRRSEIEEREKQRAEGAKVSRSFMARSDVLAVLKCFGEKLDSFRSKAEIYRYLRGHGFHVGSQSTFSSKWEGGTAWAAGWRSERDGERAMEALGNRDALLAEEIARMRDLDTNRRLTVVRELMKVR